jgi:lipoate-protein ligase A
VSFRLIIDGPLDAATNMARDESLLESVGRGESPPTLRFYQWSPAAISLGYFQEFSEFKSLAPPAGNLDVVRRQTGGGAILHDLELTYSLTVPVDHPFVKGNASRMYETVHDAATALLRELGVPVERGPVQGGGCSQRGPFFCFERHGPIDLLADGRKIMGSAQRRTASAVLQHGSLILDSRYSQQQCAIIAEFARVEPSELASALARCIIGSPVDPGGFTRCELERATQLRDKYGGMEWTRRL